MPRAQGIGFIVALYAALVGWTIGQYGSDSYQVDLTAFGLPMLTALCAYGLHRMQGKTADELSGIDTTEE